LSTLDDAIALEFTSHTMVGRDLRIMARVPGCDRF
jgi:hypothetical protein